MEVEVDCKLLGQALHKAAMVLFWLMVQYYLQMEKREKGSKH